MRLSIDPSSTVPLFDQIAQAVRRELIAGSLRVGDHLPPAKDLARVLRVNLHTMLRAYAILRDEGLVEVRRGRGTVVISTGRQSGNPRLDQAVQRVAVEARRAGLTEDALVELVLRAFRVHTDSDNISD